MKTLHLMINEKFTFPYIEFIEKNFEVKDHFFYIIGGKKEFEIPKKHFLKSYIKKINNPLIKGVYLLSSYLALYPKAIESEKIILHGLFNPLTIIFLFLNPWFLKKSYWVIWGGDLYSYKEINKEKEINKIYSKIEKFVKSRLKGYITHIKGDYLLAKKWFSGDAIYYNCFMYPSNMYKDFFSFGKNEKKKLYIQVGNSADPSNNHLEILEKLESFKENNIKIFCPLSYGCIKHTKKVIEYGENTFGERFIPIIDFMKIEDYLEFIANIDIAIFAHDRQQGVGNIISLLGMGKTVYIKKEITTYNMLEELEVKIGDFNKFDSLKLLEKNEQLQNRIIIKTKFSEENLKKEWRYIFDN